MVYNCAAKSSKVSTRFSNLCLILGVMNIVRRLSFSALAMVILNSCFEPPEYSSVPQIEFNSISFIEVGGFSDPDSLILRIDFKDGDGALGLDPNDPNHTNEPFHDSYYFLEDGAGGLTPIATEKRYSDRPAMLKISGEPGKLASSRTPKKPLYSYIPTFQENGCPHPYVHNGVADTLYYMYGEIHISAEDGYIIDDCYQIIDTLRAQDFPDIYVVEDTILFKPNPRHNNIRVEFLVQNNDGTFTKFNWSDFNCGTTFDGRFPVLEDRTRAVEGTLQYAMTSVGFLPLFSSRPLKLRVTIWDRALNQSNVIETQQPFTLNDIRKGG